MNWLAVLLALASHRRQPGAGRRQAQAALRRARQALQVGAEEEAQDEEAKPKATLPVATPATGRRRAPTTVNPSPRPSGPGATPTPTTTADADTPTPTPTPDRRRRRRTRIPTRTGVDLIEFRVRSSYQTLAAGEIDFNVTDLGEDDHNLSIRGGGKEYGGIDLHSGDADVLHGHAHGRAPTRSTATSRPTKNWG